MKKYLEYIGLLMLTVFSFYYTDKVTTYMNSKDPIMINIKEYKSNNDTYCNEGYISTSGVVLGSNGKEVNVEESYSSMQGVGYDEELMVFDEVTCKVSLDKYIDNYIISGNESKNMISILVLVSNIDNIKTINNIGINKGIKLNYVISDDYINNEYINKLYSKDYSIILNGKDIDNYSKYYKEGYCITLNNEDLSYCKDIVKINGINYYNKDIFNNIKNNLNKGSIYIIKDNSNTIEELSSLINYIKGKNIDIVTLRELLK